MICPVVWLRPQIYCFYSRIYEAWGLDNERVIERSVLAGASWFMCAYGAKSLSLPFVFYAGLEPPLEVDEIRRVRWAV